MHKEMEGIGRRCVKKFDVLNEIVDSEVAVISRLASSLFLVMRNLMVVVLNPRFRDVD